MSARDFGDVGTPADRIHLLMAGMVEDARVMSDAATYGALALNRIGHDLLHAGDDVRGRDAVAAAEEVLRQMKLALAPEGE